MIERDSADFVFDVDQAEVVSSGDILRPAALDDVTDPVKLPEPSLRDELSPIFKELATPKLPELSKQNRARLQMQSPNRLFFYWSMRNNPFQILNKAFSGHPGSYTLVNKLLDLTRGTEEIHPVDPEGTWWFNVDAGSDYRAEIGFYAPNRPYFRVMFSNTVTTPRKSPSPRAATSADWTITADRFARVLDVAGYSQDAFDVALAGDDWDAAGSSTHAAFSKFIGHDKTFNGLDPEDIRYALLAIASGLTLEDLRYRIGANLFALLQANAEKLNKQSALAVVKDEFGIEAEDMVEEQMEPAVYGASLVNFPRRLRKRTRGLPKVAPVSSHNFSGR
jgi:hypothetical protein